MVNEPRNAVLRKLRKPEKKWWRQAVSAPQKYEKQHFS